MSIPQALSAFLNNTPPGQPLAGTSYWILPALINAHDHLDFNLYPRLGTPPYPNSYQWGAEIYRPEHEPIRSILALPKRDRLLWGAYRNLLVGVTTVQHHNPRHWSLNWDFPITVPPYTWAHTPAQGTDLSRQQRLSRPERPFFIHGAEGTDATTAAEVPFLAQHNLLGPSTVLIHGINLNPQAIALLQQSGTALVWCPASNLYLYGQTAPIPALQAKGIPIALGSDSTLSGSDDLIAEIHFARRLGLVSDQVLYAMVTHQAARILGLPSSRSDFLLLEAPCAQTPWEALFTLSTATLHLVWGQGRPLLAAPAILPLLGPTHRLHPMYIDGHLRYLRGPLLDLLTRTERALGPRTYFGKHLKPHNR
ncbi:amidohydrolase family protein [Anthocerotibacter panamensis]|uniref:amidohydrolase family protein n=1 Tax=Anthocerotibacter panamensis TaxID=2857077 RepID=UPI001C4031F8|nr:amidohydrolase family protein [Anthocerotibacter panamensis]